MSSVYTIILSNSTVADESPFTVASWVVRGDAIPIESRVELIDSMSVHLESSLQEHSKALVIDIPWLQSSSSSLCASGFNPHTPYAEDSSGVGNDGADALTLLADQQRQSTIGLVIATPESTNCTCHEGEIYDIGHTQIPSVYTVSVRTLSQNLPYHNLSHLILKFRVHRSGNF